MCWFVYQDMLRDQLQSSFMQRTEQERHRKQQEMEDGLFKKNLDTVQGVDLDSQRVRDGPFGTVCGRGRVGGDGLFKKNLDTVQGMDLD